MNNTYVKLLNNLSNLKLMQIKNNIDLYIDKINNKEIDFISALYELTNFELKCAEERTMNACVKIAGFPYLKTFLDYDFSFQPQLNKDKILDLKNLRFIENKENIIFIGTPGVGKTHLATAIGIESAKNRQITYFINCNDLVMVLKKSFNENRFEDKLKTLTKYKVLIIDEVGFLPIDKLEANLFFQLINKMYERHSVIVTTNRPLSKWGEIFGDIMLANAILDRLLHHSHVITINGRSYRTKDNIKDLNEKEKEVCD